MGFQRARRRLIDALREGRYDHEARRVRSETNLLAAGDVSAEEVITLLYRCRGDQHEESRHHWDRTTTVHEFRPKASGERWYIKAYFASEDESAPVTIISVHR